MASPSRANCTSCWITACVPTTRPASPEAMRSSISRRMRPLRLPLSQAVVMPSGASQPTSLAKCCSARISVGAISAHCQPLWMAMAAASAATTVLPEPTSPCSSRCIGTVALASPSPSTLARCKSAAMSSTTRRCAPVSANGSAASSCSCSPPAATAKRGARCWSRSRLACRRDSCCASSSSNFNRCHAGCCGSSSVASGSCAGGWCSRCSASRSVARPGGSSAAGTVSDRSARCSAELTARRK